VPTWNLRTVLRQSLQAASVQLPAGLSAASAVGTTRFAMMGDQSLRKARGEVNFRFINRWLALTCGAFGCALSGYIWTVEGGAKIPADLLFALAQCVLVAVGGYFAASILLTPGREARFGRVALLVPSALWVGTLWLLVAAAFGHWSMSPMLIFPLLLGVQMAVLIVGGVVFGVVSFALPNQPLHLRRNRALTRAFRAGERRRWAATPAFVFA
jgi:hypothetical protein